jgi:hypothetical protein
VDGRDERRALGDALAERVDGTPVHRVGKILILWRPRPEDPQLNTGRPSSLDNRSSNRIAYREPVSHSTNEPVAAFASARFARGDDCQAASGEVAKVVLYILKTTYGLKPLNLLTPTGRLSPR